MDLVNIRKRMDKFMKDNGNKIKCMAKEQWPMQIRKNILVNMLMINEKVKDSYGGRMAKIIKVNGKMVFNMDKGF